MQVLQNKFQKKNGIHTITVLNNSDALQAAVNIYR